MNNWEKTTLGEVCDTISSTYKKNNEKIVLINTSDVLNGKVLNHEFVQNINIKGQFKKTFIKDDILYSEIRPQNKRFAYVDFDSKNYIASTKLMVLRYKENVLPKFLYLILSSNNVINNLQAIAETRSGTFPQITYNELSKIEINLPPLDEQKRIADVLSALDDKIEVNNKINENLEAQAQAIFKQWFVDFEFPDKEGKPYKSNGGKFIDSELGEIPEGWKVGKIRDIVLSTIGGDWGKEQKIDNYISEVYCIRGADINDIIKGNKGKMPTRFILEKNYNSKKLEANDIVIEISGGSPTQSTGRVALITDALLNRYDKSMICTNFCRAIKPLENYSYFIFYYWRYLYYLNTMFSYENGTTGIKNLDINGVLDNENVVLPNIELLNCFNNYVLNIMKTIFNNGLESENLSEIRDSLLPRLMSGEVRV